MTGMLAALDFTPRQGRKSVTLYRQREVHRYFEMIGSSNAYLLDRYRRLSIQSTAELSLCR